MALISLRTVTDTQDHTLALKDGTVTPQGFRLAFEDVPVIEAFRRMVRRLDFDVSEMAFTTYLCAREFGKPFTALPVFLVRAFHHDAVVRSATAGARSPADLAGRKVGLSRGYTVTTGVWARGILHDEYGLDPAAVTWVRAGDEHVAEYRPPPNVVPMPPGADLARLVASGELAAGIGVPAGQPDIGPLIPDAAAAGFEALRQRGLYPINHLLVVRDDLLAAHPGLAAELFMIYAEAKNRYTRRLRDAAISDPSPADQMYRRVMDITGSDPLPYGIEPNRAMIDLLVRHAVNQKILSRPVAAEDLFPETTHGLIA